MLAKYYPEQIFYHSTSKSTPLHTAPLEIKHNVCTPCRNLKEYMPIKKNMSLQGFYGLYEGPNLKNFVP